MQMMDLNTHETLKANEKFELTCRQYGVVTPQEYLADKAKVFTSSEFTRNLSTFTQVMSFSGVGAHHHNGIAERNVRTIKSVSFSSSKQSIWTSSRILIGMRWILRKTTNAEL